MAGAAELKAAHDRIRAAAVNLAGDVQRLKAHVHAGMTPDEVAEVQAEADSIAETLEGLAGETPEPEPEPEPEP